jgi:hypothetical protein
MLCIDAALSPTQAGFGTALIKTFQNVLHGVPNI